MNIESTFPSSPREHCDSPPPWKCRGQDSGLWTRVATEVPIDLEVSSAVRNEGVSIRLPDRPDWRACGVCASRFHAAGPTGFLGQTAICDPCTLEHSEALGSLLFLGLAVRAFVNFEAVDREQRYRAFDELGVVARVYERMVSPSGPARTLVLADLLAEGRPSGGGEVGEGPEDEPVQG